MVKLLRRHGLRAVRIAGADASQAGAIPVQASRRAAAVLACLALTACATHTRPALVQSFPPAPVADLKAPIPQLASLKPGATLRDIMNAHLSDAEGFQELENEVRVWRKWFAEQGQANGKP